MSMTPISWTTKTWFPILHEFVSCDPSIFMIVLHKRDLVTGQKCMDSCLSSKSCVCGSLWENSFRGLKTGWTTLGMMRSPRRAFFSGVSGRGRAFGLHTLSTTCLSGTPALIRGARTIQPGGAIPPPQSRGLRRLSHTHTEYGSGL